MKVLPQVSDLPAPTSPGVVTGNTHTGLDEMHVAWAKAVKSARERAGLDRKELARRIGLDPSMVTHMERTGHVPSRERVRKVALALNVDPHMLLLVGGYWPEELSVDLGYAAIQAAKLDGRA